MANNQSVVLVLLLAFLFLLTAPIVLVIGYYFGILKLSHIVTAATAGLFVIPVIFVFLAAIIIVIKKRRRFAMPSAAVAKAAVAKAPARYAWEGVFGPEEREHEAQVEHGSTGPGRQKATWEKRRAASGPPAANFKAAAAVVIVIALVVLVLLLANATKPGSIAGANKTAVANVTAADGSPVTLEETQVESTSTGPSRLKATWEQNVLSRILAQVFAASNATNKAQARQSAGEKPAAEIKPQRNISSVSLSAAAKKALGSIKSFGGKVKSRFVGSAISIKSGISKVPDAAWQKIAVAAVALLVICTVFYSHRTSQLGDIPKWFREWLGWLTAILAAARKNRVKVMFWFVLVAVVCAAVAAVVFRRWLGAKFPSFSQLSFTNAAPGALLAVRDFVSAYRLYILIGVFALLAIIGILFIYETRGKKKEK